MCRSLPMTRPVTMSGGWHEWGGIVEIRRKGLRVHSTFDFAIDKSR